MFVDLPKKIIEVKEKGYINSRLEIIVDTPPQWVLDELDKFFKDFKETMVLVKHLGNYSEVKNIYEQRLTQIITKNNLVKYDD